MLARDDHVIALILSWRGTSLPDVGGGLFELTVGQVTVVEHGKFVSVDEYDPGDREAMLARFAELSGAPAALPGRVTGAAAEKDRSASSVPPS